MRVTAFLPAVLWTGLIAVLSLTDGSNLPSRGWLERIHADKIVHAFLYAVLFFLYWSAFRKVAQKSLNVMVLSSILSILTGIVMEMLQWSLASGRHFDILDIIANITGVLISAVLIKISH